MFGLGEMFESCRQRLTTTLFIYVIIIKCYDNFVIAKKWQFELARCAE